MNLEQVFQLSSNLALIGWLFFIIAPRWKWSHRIVLGVIVTLLSTVYAYFVFRSLSMGDLESFGSLDGVMSLFTKREAVLVGWVHYLAFDLMTGWFILSNAARHNIRHIFLIPCLVLTFMLGPTGLLLYFVLRTTLKRSYFLNNNEVPHEIPG
jgi:hypothetical protein